MAKSKSSANTINVVYVRKYESFRLVGYEVFGRIIKECWSTYKIEAIAAEYWSVITTAIQKSDHTELPVDFTKPKQNKIKKDDVRVLEVILNEDSRYTKRIGVIPQGESKVTVPGKNLEYTNY